MSNSDITLSRIETLQRLADINDNFQKIEQFLNELALRADGQIPLEGNIDANSQRITNLPRPLSPSEAATAQWVLEQITGVTEIDSGVVTVNGRAGVVELDADDVGLGNVDNTSDADKPISTATQNALDDKVDVLGSVVSVAGKVGEVVLVRDDVGLGNVNNTADLNKPVSSPQQAAINATKFSGWAYYQHDGSSLTIDTTFKQVLIDGAGSNTNTSYLPPGASALWASNRITPMVIGDAYVVRIDLPITATSGNPSRIDVRLDLSSDMSNVIAETGQRIDKTAPFVVTVTFPLFALATFLANGARIMVRCDTGTLTLAAPAIFINRTHSGNL